MTERLPEPPLTKICRLEVSLGEFSMSGTWRRGAGESFP